MTWSTVALLAGAFLTLSLLVTVGFARWLHIQKMLDERDDAEHLARMERAWREEWRR